MDTQKSISAVCQEYLAEIERSVKIGNRSRATLASYRSAFNRLYQYINLDTLIHNLNGQIANVIYDGQRQYGGKLSRGSRRKMYSIYNAFFKWCVKQGYLDRNPIEQEIDKPRLIHGEIKPIYSTEDIRRLTGKLPQVFLSVFIFLLHTGRRRGEALETYNNFIPPLYVENINQIKFWLSKTNCWHHQDIPDNHNGIIHKIIREYGKQTSAGIEIIFPISARKFSSEFGVFVDSLSIVNDHPVHQIRRTAITEALKRTQNPYQVSKTFHVSLDTIYKHYGHVLSEDRKRLIESMDFGIDYQGINM